jgi:hypothetical protein
MAIRQIEGGLVFTGGGNPGIELAVMPRTHQYEGVTRVGYVVWEGDLGLPQAARVQQFGNTKLILNAYFNSPHERDGYLSLGGALLTYRGMNNVIEMEASCEITAPEAARLKDEYDAIGPGAFFFVAAERLAESVGHKVVKGRLERWEGALLTEMLPGIEHMKKRAREEVGPLTKENWEAALKDVGR